MKPEISTLQRRCQGQRLRKRPWSRELLLPSRKQRLNRNLHRVDGGARGRLRSRGSRVVFANAVVEREVASVSAGCLLGCGLSNLLRRVIALQIGVDRITRLCQALSILGWLISGEARSGCCRAARR